MRIVDASYFYVIARNPLGEAIAKEFDGAEVRVGPLEEMAFPE
jgi:hypothetical protein